MALAAASAALGTGVGCRRSDEQNRLVPYTKKPEEIVPGVAVYYASAFAEGEDAYGVLVKTREGRPIHIEGNPADPVHQGKVSSRVIADLLGLYDPDRLRQPLWRGQPCSWARVVGELARSLRRAQDDRKGVLIVTRPCMSPSRRKLLATLQKQLANLRVIEWEPAADHLARVASERFFGAPVLGRPEFERAEVIVSLGADFLGTLGDTTAAARAFLATRDGDSPRSRRLYVLEGTLSLTGSNADQRLAVRPSCLDSVGLGLARALLRGGRGLPAGLPGSLLEPFDLEHVAAACQLGGHVLSQIAQDLHRAGDRGLVVAGPAVPEAAHRASYLINAMLGAIGKTVQVLPARPLVSPPAFASVVNEMADGAYGAVLLWGVNPAYDFPDTTAFAQALARVPLRVSLGLIPDETSELCSLVLPENHWLESWGDLDASDRSAVLLIQPAIAPLYDTRQGEELLVSLLGRLGSHSPPSYHSYLRERWQSELYPAGSPIGFERFWSVCLHDGVLRTTPEPRLLSVPHASALAGVAASTTDRNGLELVLEPDPRLLDGRYANNGWLEELPDPIHKTCWGNHLTMSLRDAEHWALADGDLVELGVDGSRLVIPVMLEPAQASGVLGLALGYGRRAGSVARNVGVSAWPLLAVRGPERGLWQRVTTFRRTGGRQFPARAQEHFTAGARDIARSLTTEESGKAKSATPPSLSSLNPEPSTASPRWGMAIDLAACVGCGACVIACQSENNVQVVGPEQVRKGRSMHWIRVDRYLHGDPGNPRVVHEPMLCQHCAEAPCENVCPVQATNHSPDGLNQMAYNRCVGTRYCGNNCPYKVRRFNYYDFTSQPRQPLGLAYNPEVTVRPRGVMEKCTFCVQRIRNAQQVAKNARRALRDEDVQPACAVACPTQAIVFGNVLDPASPVARAARGSRGFRILEELGVRPSITYLAAVRNPPAAGPRSGQEERRRRRRPRSLRRCARWRSFRAR